MRSSRAPRPPLPAIRPALLLLAAALAGGAASARGQQDLTTTGALLGRVLDHETGQPLGGVEVVLDADARRTTLTGETGRFVFTEVPFGVHEVRLRHLGYGPVEQLVNIPAGQSVDLEIRLVPEAIAVDSIVVTARIRNPLMEKHGYYERQQKAISGYFLDGFALRRGARPSGVLRQVPRIQVVPTGRSAFARRVVIRDGIRECVPELYLDGYFIPSAGGMIDDHVSIAAIDAIEVYRGHETPPRFISRPPLGKPCGAIVVWTRR
jgi:hypothetical protein